MLSEHCGIEIIKFPFTGFADLEESIDERIYSLMFNRKMLYTLFIAFVIFTVFKVSEIQVDRQLTGIINSTT